MASSPPPPPPPPPPSPPDFSLSPPTPTFPLLTFHPPTTTTTTTAAASTSTSTSTPHRKKKRTKLLRLDIPPSTAPAPAKRKPVDPNAPKITRPCTECGKQFWSLKALFGHMRCHPERQWRGINPPPHLRRPFPPSPTTPSSADVASSSRITMITTMEDGNDDDDNDHEVAASLLMLAGNGNIGGASTSGPPTRESTADVEASTSATRFECSSCKKTFGSHQALGGHRASHKNVKGCFAITRTGLGGHDMVVVNDHEEQQQQQQNQQQQQQPQQVVMNMIVEGQTRNNNEVDVELGLGLGLGVGFGVGHRCGICLRVFSSGQALGGHMRCHWDQNQSPSQPQTPTSFGPDVSRRREAQCGLDLNLPAPVVEDNDAPVSDKMELDLRLGI